MAKCEVLNNVTHHNLKVETGYSANFGDDVNSVLVFVNEFSKLHKEYPIFLYKNPSTDLLFPVAMLGFDEKNLFLNEAATNGWDARYVPLARACGPFLIGYQNQWHGSDLEETLVIHIDMDNPRVNLSKGAELFLPMGGLSDYLRATSEKLQAAHQGIPLNQQFVAVCQKLNLIESVKLEILLDDVHEYRISGYYTISREKLDLLDAPSLLSLHSSGFLEAAFYMLSSLENISSLIDRELT